MTAAVRITDAEIKRQATGTERGLWQDTIPYGEWDVTTIPYKI